MPFLKTLSFAVALLLGAVILLAGGCQGEKENAEREKVERSADASGGGYQTSLEGPLRVMSAAPNGRMSDLSDEQTIAVTFSQPMVVLGKKRDVPDDAFEIEPALKGKYVWRGTQTLAFQPAEPLPRAEHFHVTLAAGVRSLGGDTLKKPFSWTFETPRPRLVSSTPHDHEENVGRAPTIRLRFNQPIDTTEATSYLELSFGKPVPFALHAEDGGKTLVMTPREKLPRGRSHRVLVREGLPGRLGPLGTAKAETFTFTTYDKPGFAEIDDADEGPLDPHRDVGLVFRTPVVYEDLIDAVSFSPNAAWEKGYRAHRNRTSERQDLPVELKPETRYTVTVDSLDDRFGQRVPRRSLSFRTSAYEPALAMKGGLLVIEAKEQPRLFMEGVNVDHVQLGFEPLSDRAVVQKLSSYDDGAFHTDLDYGHLPDDVPAPPRRLRLPLTHNEPGVVPLKLDSMLTSGRGILGMNMLVPALSDDPGVRTGYRSLIQVTDLSVTAKFSPHSNLIYVSRLSDAVPVAGAEVTLRDEEGRVQWRGTTGEDGRARTPGWAKLNMKRSSRYAEPTQYVFAHAGSDRAFTTSDLDDGLEPYRFGVDYDWSPEARTQEGVIFSDRGLYKAGETVHLKAILRQKTDADWNVLTDSVNVLVRDPRNEYVVDRRFGVSGHGTFDFQWTVPEDASQGTYDLQVVPKSAYEKEKAEGDDPQQSYYRERITSGDFRVESFRRATFAVDAETSTDRYVAGDFFEGTLTGRYLFGTAMGGAGVSYRLKEERGTYHPPGYPGYRFTPLQRDASRRTLARGDTVLDGKGQLEQRVLLPGTEAGAPAQLTWSGTVTNPSEQTLSARKRLTLHPGRFYVGLKPSTTFLDLSEDQTLTVNAVTVRPGGQSVGAEKIEARLVRVEWNSAREVGADGRLRWKSWRTEDTLATRTFDTQKGWAKKLSFSIEKGGRYEVRAEAHDLRGNVIRSSAYAYATGAGYVAWRRDNDDRVEVLPEQHTYAPGETAKLLVKNPYEKARALITVEREGVLSSRTRILEGSAPKIEIPLESKHIPNVFVSVMLFKGRTAPPEQTEDPGKPSFKIGYASLRVDPDERHLRVSVEPSQETYRPGAKATVALRLTNADGEGVPGEIAFSAADAGVLNLIGYAFPDPFETFYGSRPLGVTTSELRSYVIEQRNFGQKAENMGGGGGPGRSLKIREDFRPLAHWDPTIETDDAGRADVTFTLPEHLTTFRLMAVGIAGGEFGQGQEDIITQQPLMMQPALPRFARLGDTFEAGVLVSNATGKAGDVTVTAQADHLALRGRRKQTLRLKDGDTKEVRFQWKADHVGAPELTFRAKLGGEQDVFRKTIPVKRPLSKSVSAAFASTSDDENARATEGLQIPSSAVPDLGGLEVNISSTALSGLGGAVQYLFDYPYGCLEQRTSRIRPLLVADDMLDAFDLKALSGGPRDAEVQQWLGHLDDYWTGDGFSLWKGGRRTHPYLSAYVVLALAEAEAAGYDAPSSLKQKAVNALARQVRDGDRPAYYSHKVWSDSRALMLYALARHGRVLSDEIDQLARRVRGNKDAADPVLSVEGLSHLLRAVTSADEPSLQLHQAPLARRLQHLTRVDAQTAYLDAPDGEDYGWIFHADDTRATAFGMAALVEASPGSFQQLAQRMVRYLMNTRRGGHWHSTHDNAAVLDAFRAYFLAYEDQTPDFSAKVQVAGRTILENAFQGRSLKVASKRLPARALQGGGSGPARIALSKRGTGRLYYALQLTTFTTEPQPAKRKGLRVERTLQKLDGRGKPTGPVLTTGGQKLTLESGEQVRVTLRVKSPADRHYVVVDDALPAGLEAVNGTFKTTNREVQQNAGTGSGSDHWWGGFNHTEMHDDRVLLFADYLSEGEHTYSYVARATTMGTFVHPPARTEMMYQPATRGRTATGTLVVEPPPTQTAKR